MLIFLHFIVPVVKDLMSFLELSFFSSGCNIFWWSGFIILLF